MARRKHSALRAHSVVLMPRNTPFVRLMKKLALLLLIAGIPLAAWLGWQGGQSTLQDLVQQRDALLLSEQRLQHELQQQHLKQQQVELDLMLARQTYAESQQLVRTLEQQLFRLQQDLVQYQGALSKEASTPGLRIQYVDLVAADQPGVWQFRVMVTRVGSETDSITAELAISLRGEREGDPVSLTLSQMNAGLDDTLALDFRYFQVVPQDPALAQLTLPEGFVPKTLELRASNNGETLVEHSFNWTGTGVRP
jgi:hypothetical protein